MTPPGRQTPAAAGRRSFGGRGWPAAIAALTLPLLVAQAAGQNAAVQPQQGAYAPRSPSGAQAAGQDAAVQPLTVIPVEADRPERWPAGDWVPIRRQMLTDLVARTRPEAARPATTWIEEAVYAATFDGSSLRGGQLTAELRHIGSRAELLPLQPLNLAFSELSWSDGRATWGTLGNGTAALLVDGQKTTLYGQWNLTGRKLPRSVEFDVEIPSAAVSRIRLALPAEYRLAASTGELAQSAAKQQSGWNDWELVLGSQTRCHLSIRRQPDQSQVQPLVLAESNHSYVVREDGVDLQSEFQLEAINAPANLLVFSVPSDINVYSVIYGNNSSVSWRIVPAGGQQLVAVQLSDPLLGRSRPILLAGLAAFVPGRPWQLPQPLLQSAFYSAADLRSMKDEFFSGAQGAGLRRAAFVGGQSHLKVEAPLELQAIDGIGFRQTASVSTPGVSNSTSFQQYLGDAALKLQINYPEVRRDASVLTYINMLGEEWSSRVHVDWSSRAGRTFETRSALAPLWEIVEVRARNSASALANWDVRRERGGVRTLSIEFRDAIVPGSPKGVEIVARRLSAQRGRPLRIPVLRPLEQGAVDQLVAVSHANNSAPELDAGSTFSLVAPEQIPAFAAASELWQEIESSTDGNRLLLHADDAAAEARLEMQPSVPAADALVWMTHQLGPSLLTESIAVRLQPAGEPIDRLHVYLTQAGGDVAWHLDPTAPETLKAARVPADRHGEWDLPAEGELWEIPLPRPLRRTFTIVGKRSRPVEASMMPSLAAVPGVQTFRGIVELLLDPDVGVETEVEGLTPVAAEDVDLREFPEGGERPVVGRLWRFQSGEETLLLRVRHNAVEPSLRNTATLRMTSLLSNEYSGFDRHSATLRFLRGLENGVLRFGLPQPAALLSASVNGKPVVPHRRGDEWVVAHAELSGRSTVQIEYQTPLAGGRLGQTRGIVVPRCKCTILEFDWRFALPPDAWLVREPAGLLLLEPLPELSWTERFFGPLGRPANRVMFNPFSAAAWLRLGAAGPPTDTQRRPERGDRFAPSGWSVHRATAPYLPQYLVLSTRRHSQAWLLAWLGTLGCLLCGLQMRVLQWRFRKGAFGYWLSTCLFAAWLSPPFYAIIAGGCVVGTAVALLFPRRLLERLRFTKPPDDVVPLGSTASFQHVPATVLLALLCAAATSAAQEPPPRSPNDSARATKDDAKPAEALRVLVPGGGDVPASPEAIVYVDRRALANLQQAVRSREEESKYLVAAADYAGRVDEQNSVVVAAKYKVYLLPGVQSARVAFPHARSNPGRCLVDGHPHSVSLGDDEGRFYVELNAESDGSSSEGAAEFDIELEFRPATEVVSGGGVYRLEVIPVAAAHLRQDFAGSPATIELVGARGDEEFAADRRSFTAMLGNTGEFRVLWSSNAEPVQTPVHLEAAVTTLVEARPTTLEFRYRAEYRVPGGQVDFIEWQLPHSIDGMVVREVALNGEPAADFAATAAGGGGSRLLVQFAQPQERDFAVDAVVLVPIAPAARREIEIPAAALIENAALPYSVTTTRNLLGITAPPEFDVVQAAPHPLAEGIVNIGVESFLARTNERAPARPPRLAYEIRQPGQSLALTLTPAAPQRTFSSTQTATVRGEVLDWTLSADVKTSRAPAFQHRLFVSPQLSIGEIHVLEDDAERLTHWSRRGNVVDLFLSDKTTGTQRITLTGQRMIPRDIPVPLPLIQIDQAVPADAASSRLRLLHEPQWVVRLLDADSLEVTTAAVPPSAGSGARLELLGQYSLKSGAKSPQIQVRPEGAHVQSNAAVSVSPGAPGTWRITYDFQFTSDRDGPEIDRIRLRIPARLAGRIQIESPEADQQRTDQPDGSLELGLLPKDPQAHVLEARIAASVDAPPPGEWLVPKVVVANISLAGRYLLLSEELELQPAGRGADRVLPAALPARVRQLAGAGLAADEWAAYFVDAPEMLLFVGLRDAEPDVPRIPLVETLVERGADERAFGRTTVWVADFAGANLELAWPPGLSLRALLIDGQPTIPARPDTRHDSMSISLAAGPRWHQVVAHWEQPAAGGHSLWPPRSQPIPLPLRVTPERSVVAIVPPGDSIYTARRKLDGIDNLDYALDVLEGLVELNSIRGSDPERSSAWDSLLEQHLAVDETLRSGPQSSRVGREQLNRFKRLSRVVSQLRLRRAAAGDTAAAAGEQSPGPVGAPLAAPNRASLLGRVPMAAAQQPFAVTFWVVKDWFVAAVLLLVCLPLIPLVRWLVRLEIGQWLFLHQPAAWACLGLLWWTSLRPSELGMALLAVSLFVAVRERRRPADETSSLVQVPAGGDVTTGSQ